MLLFLRSRSQELWRTTVQLLENNLLGATVDWHGDDQRNEYAAASAWTCSTYEWCQSVTTSKSFLFGPGSSPLDSMEFTHVHLSLRLFWIGLNWLICIVRIGSVFFCCVGNHWCFSFPFCCFPLLSWFGGRMRCFDPKKTLGTMGTFMYVRLPFCRHGNSLIHFVSIFFRCY